MSNEAFGLVVICILGVVFVATALYAASDTSYAPPARIVAVGEDCYIDPSRVIAVRQGDQQATVYLETGDWVYVTGDMPGVLDDLGIERSR